MTKKKSYSKELKVRVSPFNDYWNKYNFYLLYFSIGLLIIGFYLMSIGSWESTASLNISPIVIILTYLILLPVVILFKTKSKQKDSGVSSKS